MSSDPLRRCPSPTLFPPSISYGSPTHPNIELTKPVWEVVSPNQAVTVSGEIEVDISMFRSGEYHVPFSIGIHFTDPSAANESDLDSENVFRAEWNQDGPGNYYRSRSCIKIFPRLIVDDVCYVKFAIVVPPNALPDHKTSRVFDVSVKVYELDNPFNATEPSSARFMVLNWTSSSDTSPAGRRSLGARSKLSFRRGRASALFVLF